MNLSQRVTDIVPSPTLILDATAKRMIREGHDVVNLSVGEPDTPTPQSACERAIEAMQTGMTRYTDVAGHQSLRQAIADHVKARLNLTYAPDQVVVSNGGKHALFNVFAALLNPGDEVLIQTPYWVSYPEQVKLCGGVPVLCKTTEATGFKMNGAMLEELVTPRTKLLVINSPSNPSGAVYSLRELEDLAHFAIRHRLVIISDEIYDQLIYDGQAHWSIAQLSPHLLENTVIVNGWSKTWGMTGWRLGYTLSNARFARAFRDLQGHVTSNVCSVAQWAALGALESNDPDMQERFSLRRDYLVRTLRAIPGVKLASPQGAFYAFPNLSHFVGRRYKGHVLTSVDELCVHLLSDYKVSIVPGSGFGSPDNARISYAVDLKRLVTASDRINQFLREVGPAQDRELVLNN